MIGWVRGFFWWVGGLGGGGIGGGGKINNKGSINLTNGWGGERSGGR